MRLPFFPAADVPCCSHAVYRYDHVFGPGAEHSTIQSSRRTMKTSFITSIITLTILSTFAFGGETVKETTFKVDGLCGMCKTRIEKAMKISEVKMAKWDKKSRTLKVAYVDGAITVDSLQQRAAAVGHDTEKYKATTEAYENLPGCCLYRSGEESH
jgi:hypothetical protein